MEKILPGMYTLQNRYAPARDGARERDRLVMVALKHDIRNVLMAEESLLHPESVRQILDMLVMTDRALHRVGGMMFWKVVVNGALKRAERLPEGERHSFVLNEIMKTRGTQQQCKSQVRLFGLHHPRALYPAGLGARVVNQNVSDGGAFCGVREGAGMRYGSLGQCKKKRQTRYWGLVTPLDREWDPHGPAPGDARDVAAENNIGRRYHGITLGPHTTINEVMAEMDRARNAPPQTPPRPLPELEQAMAALNLASAASTPGMPPLDPPSEPAPLDDFDDLFVREPPAHVERVAPFVSHAAEDGKDGKEEVPDRKGKGVMAEEGKKGKKVERADEDAAAPAPPRTKRPKPGFVKTYKSRAPTDGMYHPRRMPAPVDANFTYDNPDIDTYLVGEKIAFKRGAKGDGNCFWYSFFISKAFQDNKDITQKELHARVMALKQEIKETKEYFDANNPLDIWNFGPVNDDGFKVDRWIKNMNQQLRDRVSALDAVIAVVAFHTKTDIYVLNAMGQEKDDRDQYRVGVQLFPGVTRKEWEGRQQRGEHGGSEANKPVYIFHEGDHFEPLIAESDVAANEAGGAVEPETVEEQLEAMKEARGQAGVEKSVERLESTQSGSGDSYVDILGLSGDEEDKGAKGGEGKGAVRGSTVDSAIDLSGDDHSKGKSAGKPPAVRGSTVDSAIDLSGDDHSKGKSARGSTVDSAIDLSGDDHSKGKSAGKPPAVRGSTVDSAIDLSDDEDVIIMPSVPIPAFQNNLFVKTTPCSSGDTYHPWRMDKWVDVDFTYNYPRLDERLYGDKIAFKRGSLGDGNCFWYSFLESKAFQENKQITQAELKSKVEALKKEIKGVVDNNGRGYFDRSNPYDIYNLDGDFADDKAYKKWRDEMDARLRMGKFANDEMMAVVAFHTKTDICSVSIHNQKPGTKDEYNVTMEYFPGAPMAEWRKIMKKGKRGSEENKPVYIWHDRPRIHFEALITQSAVDANKADEAAKTSANEEDAVRALEELYNVTGAVDVMNEHMQNARERKLSGILTPEDLSDDAFRKRLEKEIVAYNGPDDPRDSDPRRPVEVHTKTYAPAPRGKGKGKEAHKMKQPHPPTSMEEANESIKQFTAMPENRGIPVNYHWSPMDADIVDVQYVRVPGGLKVQVKFDRKGDFVDWLLVAKSRLLKGFGIDELGLYADQFIPAGKFLGLYTGRILGTFDPRYKKAKGKDAEDDDEPLKVLRKNVVVAIGENDKFISHTYNVPERIYPLLVDGGHGGIGFGTKDGQTFDPLNVGVVYPWTYLHVSNDPRGAVDPRTGKNFYPNAKFGDGWQGLRAINPIYPREEIAWTYDGSTVLEGQTFEPEEDNKMDYSYKLYLYQQVARNVSGAKAKLDNLIEKETRDAVKAAAKAMKAIVDYNEKYRVRKKSCRPSRKCQEDNPVTGKPLLLDEIDLRNVEEAVRRRPEHAQAKTKENDWDKLKRSFEMYNKWREESGY
eukprot:jgi/Mesvir1/16593/Mv10128-RA.1